MHSIGGAMPRSNRSIGTFQLFAALGFALAAGEAHAQLAHGCAPVTNAEFKLTTLVARPTGIEEPIKMAFDMDAQNNVDIYWVERLGKVKKYTATTKAVSTLGALNYALNDYEGGGTGIILDPEFKTNRMMYLYYSNGKEGAYSWRVSRFVLNGAGTLDMASERIILNIPAQFSRMHTGGAMLFDPQGNLWITTGENQSGEEGPPNTNDLRGKILRIKPIMFSNTETPVPGAGTTYTVPAGNLFAPGLAKTRPEIYVMGGRNPYSLSMDPVRKVITWGDIGPDGKGQTEEHNMTAVPGNFGYPYFAGNNILLQGTAPASKPMNNAPKNTGLNELPPAIPALNSYQQQAAITGPVFRYNGTKPSDVRMPPHFDGLWFVTDFQTGYIDTLSLNKEGTAIIAKGRAFTSFHFDRPIDFQQGPDGALYIMNYAGWFGAATTTGIQRIEYTGGCRPVMSTGLAPDRSRMQARGTSLDVDGLEGSYTVVIGDLQGRTLKTLRGEGARSFDLASLASNGNTAGVYTAKLISAHGVKLHSFVLGAR
jgi:cytochrome c